MPKLKCLDYYHIAGLLTPEEVMVQAMARDFVEREVMPVITEAFRTATFPGELIPKMAEAGFLGANLPPEYGGGGLSNVAYGLLCQELERGDSGVRSFCSVTGGLVMYPILRYGSEEQKRYWLPMLAKGEKIGCFGLTEPDHGSDPASMETRARREGDTIVLNGAKMWITNGSIADVAVVWARDEEGVVRGYLVEKGTPGFSAPEMRNKFSLRASVTSELLFDECRIPATNQLPGAAGLRAPLSCLTQARYSIAWGALGAAMACYEAARSYAAGRVQFGRPIAAYQLTQQKLAKMLVEITKGQLLALQLGRLKDQGTMTHQQVSLAKLNNVAVARECSHLARTILGANGITDEYPVIRHMLNMETLLTYEGTHEMHTLVLGADITGIEAWR